MHSALPARARFLLPETRYFASPASLSRQFIVRTMSSQPTEQEPKILGVDRFDTPAKWLRLERIKWQDQEGKERFWEVANRSTRKGPADSCHILALLNNHDGRSVVLIEQYRPPVASTVIEFPAGLIEEGEDAATTALRELYEETGYKEGARVRSVSPLLVKDPGMTGANMFLVTVEVDVPADSPLPEPKLDPGEHILKRLVPLKDLDTVLKDYASRGFAIDALVQSVATGLSLA